MRPSSTQSRLARGNRIAEDGRLIAVDQSVRNAGLAARVVDDFPEAIPVTRHELDVIETYLGALLDEASASAQSGTTDQMGGRRGLSSNKMTKGPWPQSGRLRK
jgi:hypothetical protein